MEESVLNLTNYYSNDMLKEINSRFWDIPFDNSIFQTQHFVIDAYITPERKYRAAALRLQSRLTALQEVKFSRLKDDVKIRKLKHRLISEKCEFEKELIEIEIEEINSKNAHSEKLINDAIVECSYLYNYIVSCPKYTRDDFENAEKSHFEKRLLLEANGITGALKSLYDMGVDIDASNVNQALLYKENKDEPLLR